MMWLNQRLCLGRGTEKYPDPKLTVALFDVLCPWLPARWRDSLRCGMPHAENNIALDYSECTEGISPQNEHKSCSKVFNLSYINTSGLNVSGSVCSTELDKK